jgi:hypothetical protein
MWGRLHVSRLPAEIRRVIDILLTDESEGFQSRETTKVAAVARLA